MTSNVAHKPIRPRRANGDAVPGAEVAPRLDGRHQARGCPRHAAVAPHPAHRRVHLRGRARHPPAPGRRGAGGRPGPRHRRGQQPRPGVEPRERRPGPAPPRPAVGADPRPRAHPPARPGPAGPGRFRGAATHFRRLRPRPDRARRRAARPRPAPRLASGAVGVRRPGRFGPNGRAAARPFAPAAGLVLRRGDRPTARAPGRATPRAVAIR